MTIADLVYEQVKTLPDQLAREVLDFVGYLRDRQERREWRNLAEAQAGSLAPVWDNVEDEVWTMFERGDPLRCLAVSVNREDFRHTGETRCNVLVVFKPTAPLPSVPYATRDRPRALHCPPWRLPRIDQLEIDRGRPTMPMTTGDGSPFFTPS